MPDNIIETKHGKYIIIPIIFIPLGSRFRFNKSWWIKHYTCFRLSAPGKSLLECPILQVRDYADKNGAVKWDDK